MGESPGPTEEIVGEPFIGASGELLNRNLKKFNVERADCSLTNAILCRPDKKTSPSDWDKAIECCAPRLERELAGNTAPILAVGGKALQALTDSNDKINAWRGSSLPPRSGITAAYVLPTIHPAFILRNNHQLDPVFRLDMRRALDPKAVAWTWPEIIIEEGDNMVEALERILAAKLPIGLDVETAGIDPIDSGLLCIGIANTDTAVSIPWRPHDQRIEELSRTILRDSRITKVLHNAQFDLLVLKHQDIEVQGKIFDTLLAHAVVANKLPHNLGFVASCEFPAPRWKTEFRDEDDDSVKSGADWGRRDPHELRTYNLKDAWMTVLLKPRLEKRLEKTNRGWKLYRQLMELSDLAMRMRDRGVLVSRERLEIHRERLTAAMAKKKAEFLTLCPLTHVLRGKELKTRTQVYIGPYRLGENGAHEDVRRLFFSRFKCRVFKRTESGKASIDDEVLEHVKNNYPEPISSVARIILEYRSYQKLLSVYVDGLPINRDGVVRAVWKCFGTVTGRFASSDPNLMNQPSKMRDIFIARSGKIYVAADYKQLEGKIAAQLSGDELLLEWYRQGKNIYLETARRLWGESITKDSKEYKVAKQAILLMNYGGGVDTMHRAMLKKGLKVSQKAVQEVYDFWFADHPGLKAFQDDMIRFAHEEKYVEGPVSGRRVFFHLGKVEPTVAVNHPVQDTAAAIKNEALLKIDKLLDWQAGESIAFDVHDEIVLEGAVENTARLIDILKSCMHRKITLNGIELDYGIDIEVGPDFGNMKAVSEEK